MRTTLKSLLLAAAVLALAAPAAFAGDNGQGLYGEVNDKVVTFFGLGLVVFFPLLALVLSFIQGRLQQRADERKDAIFKSGK